jgi:hypothetical protein
VTAAALGGVPVAEITVDRVEPRHVVLYFHGVARPASPGRAGPGPDMGAALARHAGVPTRCS